MARIPLSWLREYADPPVAAAAIAERLSVSTCEVERIVRSLAVTKRIEEK